MTARFACQLAHSREAFLYRAHRKLYDYLLFSSICRLDRYLEIVCSKNIVLIAKDPDLETGLDVYPNGSFRTGDLKVTDLQISMECYAMHDLRCEQLVLLEI